MNIRTLFIFFLLLIFNRSVSGQVFTDSNLPIVIINTDNSVPIVDNPRVQGSMKIIYRGPGQRNYLTDQNNTSYLNYNGRIEIEIRGSSTQERPKKQYGFTTLMNDNLTNNNVGLLGMPEENDWILNAMVFDPALIRDYLCYNLSRMIGEYASRTAYCEVIINGAYRGLYLLQEKIKADRNRVDVTKIEATDNSIPDITGGYIIKADKTTGGDPVAWTMKDPNGSGVAFIHHFPDPEDVTLSQSSYIHNRFTFLEIAALTGNISPPDGFPYVIDIPSFINYMVISELASNADAYQFSTYFHKDRNGKLRAGPVWDNDLTFGNDLFFWGYNRSKTNVWQLANGDNEGARFWRDLIVNDEYRCLLAQRWHELTQPGQPLNQVEIGDFIDQTADYISEAVGRNDILWGNTGSQIQKIQDIKAFVATRISWISSNLPYTSPCGTGSLPPLVISGIMYHPAESVQYPDNDDMEFLEITNNGGQAVDPAGVFFSGTGFVFEFPSGTTIEPYSSVILAGNTRVFRSLYGFTPYGEFTRNLSDRGEDLVMCDAFGNIIDRVSYHDTDPWPEADGNGSYLKLINHDMDNNDPYSWTASNDLITSSGLPEYGPAMKIFPNPAADILNIESEDIILRIFVQDLYGRNLKVSEPGTYLHIMDLSDIPQGIYIINVETPAGRVSHKIIRLKY